MSVVGESGCHLEIKEIIWLLCPNALFPSIADLRALDATVGLLLQVTGTAPIAFVLVPDPVFPSRSLQARSTIASEPLEHRAANLMEE